MERVTGVGGIFFKAKDPERLKAWYVEHLGVPVGASGYVMFVVGDGDRGAKTVWSTFPADTRYYEPSTAPFMINYRVRDLAAMIAQLERGGVAILGREEGELGKFAWVLDPEGNKVELWEPPANA